jgi:carboxylesterase
MRRMPNVFIWWDQKAKAKIQGAPQAYPRFATRSVGEIVALGREIRRAAAIRPPAAQRLSVIASESDNAVHRGLVLQLATDWIRHAPQRVSYHAFPAHLRVRHDMIDPTQPNQRIDLVYPVLKRMALGA